MDWAKTTARRDDTHLCLGLSASYIRELTGIYWLYAPQGFNYDFLFINSAICIQSSIFGVGLSNMTGFVTNIMIWIRIDKNNLQGHFGPKYGTEIANMCILLKKTCLILNEKIIYIIHMLLHRHFVTNIMIWIHIDKNNLQGHFGPKYGTEIANMCILLKKTCLILNEKIIYIIHMLLHRHFELWPPRNAIFGIFDTTSDIFILCCPILLISFLFCTFLQVHVPKHNLQVPESAKNIKDS